MATPIIDTITQQPDRTPTKVRWDEMTVTFEAPVTRDDGTLIEIRTVSIRYDDPRLTTNQQDQFLSAARFVARINGLLPNP